MENKGIKRCKTKKTTGRSEYDESDFVDCRMIKI